MPWYGPKTPKALTQELTRFSLALRQRAANLLLPQVPFRGFPAEVAVFVRNMRFRVKHLERGVHKPGATREDMRQARLRAMEALRAAVAYLEARVFEDFGGSTDRQGVATVFKAAAELLEADARALLAATCGCEKKTATACGKARGYQAGKRCACACHKPLLGTP